VLPFTFHFSCALFASVHIYDERDQRLLLPGPFLPRLMSGLLPNQPDTSSSSSDSLSGSSSPSFEDTISSLVIELMLGTLHNKYFPVRLFGGVGLLWVLRFILLHLSEVMKLLSAESTYNIKVLLSNNIMSLSVTCVSIHIYIRSWEI
jgi:hypothetical protein